MNLPYEIITHIYTYNADHRAQWRKVMMELRQYFIVLNHIMKAMEEILIDILTDENIVEDEE